MCCASVKGDNNLEIIHCIREQNRDVIRDYCNYSSEINSEVCAVQPGVLWHSQYHHISVKHTLKQYPVILGKSRTFGFYCVNATRFEAYTFVISCRAVVST